jgi:hypothetical protein
MTDDNSTTAGLDQADEEILTYTLSDEALEAASGTERAGATQFASASIHTWPCCS